jgi:hypothetical protein
LPEPFAGVVEPPHDGSRADQLSLLTELQFHPQPGRRHRLGERLVQPSFRLWQYAYRRRSSYPEWVEERVRRGKDVHSLTATERVVSCKLSSS